MQIVLGSQSPRRREILSYFDIPFKQVASNFDEDSIPFDGDPMAYANRLARAKAAILLPQFPHDLILTADTIVYRNGKIYGKPRNHQEAFSSLKELVGQWHSVFTGLTLCHNQREYQAIEETRVLFNLLTDHQIETYYKKIPYADKAGGYMIQESGGLIIKRIEGCYYNVLGLPINSLQQLFKPVGIDLWDHLK
jgi:septum formation protein